MLKIVSFVRLEEETKNSFRDLLTSNDSKFFFKHFDGFFFVLFLAEHSTWQPGLVMVGLLSCAVPTGLKAEILNAIAALAKTPEIAFSIWQNIEAAQLINTIPTTSQQRPLGE